MHVVRLVSRWLLWLVALAVLVWLAVRFLAPAPEAEPPAAAPSTAPADVPAPADTTAAPADPLVVGDVDVGAGVVLALDEITGAFADITDPASARAALPRLIEARDKLAGLESSVAALPEDGRTVLKAIVSAAMPRIRDGAERLLSNGEIAGVIRPVVDDILASLTAFSA